MKNLSKLWVMGYLILVIGTLFIMGVWVISVDPYIHYHMPNIKEYFYTLDNQRYQNDGISRHFDYNALITGTSMTENFKTTEMDDIFGTNSIKVPYSGASYKEINDNLANALEYNPNLKTIVRGLDMVKFLDDKDDMWAEPSEYPMYLYDNDILNDVNYIFNRDVIFQRMIPMALARRNEDFQPGITSLDEYCNWMENKIFGREKILTYEIEASENAEPVYLSEEERKRVVENVHQNITSLAQEYPDVTFYYFFTPYSILWWKSYVENGTIYKHIEAEMLIIEEILKCENIKLFSFNNLSNIVTDLNNYKDTAHYGSWINSLILHYMKDGKCLLTYDNYMDYLTDELVLYTTYDYTSLNNQVDYEEDDYAEAVLNFEINGVQPIDILSEFVDDVELINANVVTGKYNDKLGIECKGSLQREVGSEISLADYIANIEYVGAKITIDDISDYKYLVFYGKKEQDHGQPSVYIYDQNNTVLAELALNYQFIDEQWHQYFINVSQLTGTVTIVWNGGYIDNTGSADSLYTFSDIIIY